MKTSIKASLIAAAIASFPIGGLAAGLGQINVYSGLGQPLRAEIQISATAQELTSINARIASPDAFRQANIAYPGFISGIKVSVDTKGQRPVVRLSSDRPINEPFVGLLVELDWASGRLAREYTFLLDPVEELGLKPAAARVEPPRAQAPTPVAQAPASPRAAPSAGASVDSYRVQRGDTLLRIAEATRREGTTLDQMLMALFRANPAAFDGDNINRLRAGAILTVPPADAVVATSSAEARREIVAQAADFEAYRRRLAGTVAAREAEPAAAAQESAGRIVPKVEDARAPAETGDKLQISKTDSAASAGAENAAAARLQALEEELVAREKGLEEANARLALLEQNIRDLQKLLELKSQPLAQLQGGATPAPGASSVAEAPTPSAPAAADTAASAPSAETAAPTSEQATETVPAVPADDAPAATEAPSAPVAAAEPEPAPTAAVAPPPAPEPAVAPAPIEDEASLFDDPAMLAAGGGVLVLLLAFAAYRARQRKKDAEALNTSALMSEFPPDSSAVFGATGGQSVDTGNSSILQTDFSQSGLSSIDADEGVDPVAEADVYMAYGRDAQAEEILEDALKADPNRPAIYLKLLEIFAQRQSLKQFETTASELYARTSGQGPDWDKAALMGRRIDPDNPLYTAGPLEAERTIPPSTELPANLMPDAAAGTSAGVVVGAAAALAAAAHAQPAEETGPSLASLDFTSSSPNFTSSAPIEPSPSQFKDTWTMPGDISQLSQGGEGAPEIPETTDLGIEEPAAMDADSIDFDLGGEDDSSAGSEQSEASTEALSSTGDLTDSGLDLDLGADDFIVEETPAALEAETGEAVVPPQIDSSATVLGEGPGAHESQDAPLEFDLPDLAAPASDKPAAFDMSATVIQSSQPQSDSDDAVMDLEKTSFDSSLLDFDFELDTPEPTKAEAGLDLTSIDLDLEPVEEPGPEPELAPELAPATVTIPPVAAAGDDEVLDHEVETKLELARAYDEMGDKEGALELLNEVMAEGSAAQQAAARTLIEKLG